MALTSPGARDQLMAALASNVSQVQVAKASIANTAIGQYHSMWRTHGQPGQGALPGVPIVVCDHTTTGALPVAQPTAPTRSYLASAGLACSTGPVTIAIHDRLVHCGALVGNTTSEQLVDIDMSLLGTSNLSARKGADDFRDVTWWLEWYSDTGATAATVTVAVTYNDGTTGDLTGASLAATRRASFMLPLNGLIPAAAAGKYIRGVATVVLSVSTGTAGNFGVTATRQLASIALPTANQTEIRDWAQLGLAEVPNSACLQMIMMPATTSTGTVNGTLKIAHA